MSYIKRYFSDWTTLEKSWVIVCCSGLALCTILDEGTSMLGLVGSVSGAISIVLCAKGKIENYPFGLVQVAIFAYICYETRYYGQAAANIIMIPLIIMGMITWKKNMRQEDEHTEVKARRMTPRDWVIHGVIFVVITALFSLLLIAVEGFVPVGDAIGLSLNLAAFMMQIRRYSEQWIMWIISDAWYIIMWVIALLNDNPDSSILLISYVFYLINCIYGYYNWRKLEKKHPSAAAVRS